MKKWNSLKFHTAIKEITKSVKNGEWQGDDKGYNLKQIKEICLYIADVVLNQNVSEATVYEWTKERNSGPGEEWIVIALENALGISLTQIEDDVDVEIKSSSRKPEEGQKMEKYSDFVKQNIREVYGIILHYIENEDLTNEDAYFRVENKVDAYMVGIPKDIFMEISIFLGDLEEIVFKKEKYFERYTDFRNEILKKDGQQALEFATRVNLLDDLREFGMKKLYPHLVD